MSYKQSLESMGIKEFRCQICNKKLILSLTGSSFELILQCSRCKTIIMVFSPEEEIPIVVRKMRELQLKQQKKQATEQFKLKTVNDM